MYELRVAARYVFRPRWHGGVSAAMILFLCEVASGVLLMVPGLNWPAPWLAALPIAAATAVGVSLSSKASFWRHLGIWGGIVLAAHLMEALALVVGPRFRPALLTPAVVPSLTAVVLAAVQARAKTKKLTQALAIAIGLTVVGLLALAANHRLRGAPPQYAGALLVVVGAFGLTITSLLSLLSTFTAISVLGVVLGAASLITVRSVTRGFAREFQTKVLGFNAHVLVMKDYYGFSGYKKVAETIRHLPHVTGASPFTIAEMIVTARRRHTTILVKGVDPERVQEVLDLPKYLQVSRRRGIRSILEKLGKNLDRGMVLPGKPDECLKFDEDGDPIPGSDKNCPLPGIVIGRGLARRLKVHVGDTLRLISPMAELQAYQEQDTTTPLARDFRIVGVFYCGFEEYDDKLVFVHLDAVKNFVAPAVDDPDSNSVLGIEIKLDDIYQAGAVARLIAHKLKDEDIRIDTWYTLNKPLFEALQSQRKIMTAIVSITVIVAAFGILAALTMMVVDKTREIAILKALGATSGGIARVFNIAGVLIGMLGVGLGIGLGLLNCWILSQVHFPLDPKVYLISSLPVLVDLREVAYVVLGGLILCVGSTLYPSRKAASYRPVEGLRYE